MFFFSPSAQRWCVFFDAVDSAAVGSIMSHLVVSFLCRDGVGRLAIRGGGGGLMLKTGTKLVKADEQND